MDPQKDRLFLSSDQDIKLLENVFSAVEADDQDHYLNPEKPFAEDALPPKAARFLEAELTWNTVRSLGVGVDPQAQLQRGGHLPEEYDRLAGMLAASTRPFALACLPNSSGSVDFRLGMAQDPEGSFVNSIMSATFGLVELESAPAPETEPVAWSCHCAPVVFDTASLDRTKKRVPLSYWADAAAASLIGTRCAVQVDFSPVPAEWADEELRRLSTARQELAKYLKQHSQLTVSQSESGNNSTNQHKLFSFIRKKTTNESDGISASVSLSRDFAAIDPQAEAMEAKLRYQVRLMEQIKQAGWMVRILVTAPKDEDADASAVRAALGAALVSIGYACSWALADTEMASQVSVVLPAYMASTLISLPTKPFAGFALRRRSQLNLNPPMQNIHSGDSVTIGSILWNGGDTEMPLRIPRKELNRHTAVFGMTGGGKTTTVCNLLSSLRDIHYLVIEPVKGEYHALSDIQRFTMIAGSETALHMNPFWFPQGSSLQYHIDSLKLIIASAFDLYAAMPNILEQCLYRVYLNCGWNLVSGQNMYVGQLPENDLYPTFQSLCNEIERYLNESAFEGETAGNYRGALLSRLQSFTSGAKGVLLNTYRHIDFDLWETQNVVVELDALADDADKAIVMGALLVQYFQYIKYCSKTDRFSRLRHLFVLEEAHHLFREDVPNAQNVNGNSTSNQLTSMLNNLLAEIRAYGEGFLIIDQSPSGISPSVLKNTAVKIVHRVDYGDDIRLLRSALLLEEGDSVTASLEQGEALIRFGTMQSPAHVRIPPYLPKEEKRLSCQGLMPTASCDIQDRIFGDKELMRQFIADAQRFLNVMLFVSDRANVQKAFDLLRQGVLRQVSRYCGWDSMAYISKETFYFPLLNTCVAYAAEEMFPKQYCLNRMIVMYVHRIAEFMVDRDFGGLTENAWDVLADYRQTNIYTRISFYYQNEPDLTVRMIVAILGTIPEAGILKPIVDSLWMIPRTDEEQFHKKFLEVMDALFYVPPPEETEIYLREMAKSYCENASQL